jgi:hypothetical protein
MIVNGITTAPTVVAHPVPLDCCSVGRFVVTTSDFSQPIAIEWRVQGGVATVLPPATVDIGSLPSGWSVTLYAGCSVTSAGCLGALDTFNSGFAGSLSLTRVDGSPGLDWSLCMHFEEPTDKPGTYVHTLDLYPARLNLQLE